MKINAIYKISENPLIWTGTGPKNWEDLKNTTNKEAYLLVHPMWEFSLSSLVLYFKQKMSLKKRNIKLILLHNSKVEYNFSRFFGFDSRLINQNIHCCEHDFQVLKDVQKKYDAIYIAAAKPYKRLWLAEKIKSLFVVTYFWPDVKNEKGEWELHKFEPKIKHCDFNRFRINANEVALKVNESRCSLALSKKEGAMWAVMESLLSGVPVVSTKSKGGRDFFLTEDNSVIIQDTVEDVCTGVKKIMESDFNAEEVRTHTLSLIEPYRQKYLDLIFELLGVESIHFSRDEMYTKLWGNSKGISNIRII